MSDLDECFHEAEMCLKERDNLRIDLAAANARLVIRTPTVAAQLVEPPAPAPPPEPGLDLPLALALVAAGIAAGALGALALSR